MKMIKRKNRSGIMLLDLMLAFSFAGVFVAMITGSSSLAKDIFEKAVFRKESLDAYSSNEYLYGEVVPDQSLSFSTSSNVRGRWYGNHMVEKTFSLATGSVNFSRVDRAEVSDQVVFGSDPLCTVDFSSDKIVGSYDYFFSPQDGDESPVFRFQSVQIHLPVNPDLPLTDLEVRNGIAYVSADSASYPEPDFMIFDIKDPTDPVLLSRINTGPGISSISIVGRRVYASLPSTVAELQVFRLNSLNDPVLESSYRLPLPYATATPALGSAIFYEKGKVYLGTEKWHGEEFNIIDVSDPLSSEFMGGFEIGSKVNDIFVIGDIAYVTASNHHQMLVLDVSDPADPGLMNSFSPVGWERQEGKAVSFFERSLFLGRTSGGFDLESGHEAFGWPTSSSATLLDHRSKNIPGGVYGIIEDRSYLYLASRQVGKEFEVLDQELGSSLFSASLPIAPQAMTCDRDSFYILANRAPFIYKISL